MTDIHAAVMETLSRLDEVIRTAERNRNLAAAVLDIVDSAPEEAKAQVLQLWLDTMKRRPTTAENSPPVVWTDGTYDDFRYRYGVVVDAILDEIVRQNPTPEVFAQRVLEMLAKPFFTEPLARAFALHWVTVDHRVPYFPLHGGGDMPEAEWQELTDRLGPQFSNLSHIAGRGFRSRSKEAFELLQVLNRPSPAEQVRLLSYLLSAYEQRGYQAGERAARRRAEAD